MFALSRWPGPDAASKQEKENGALSLQELHARARQRAARRCQQGLVDQGGERAESGKLLSTEIVNGNVNTVSDPGGNESKGEVQTGSKSEKRKRKLTEKKDVEMSDKGVNLVDDVYTPILDSDSKKKRKEKGGVETALVQSELLVDNKLSKENTVYEKGRNAANGDTVPKEKVRKKKITRDADQRIHEDSNVETAAAVVDVSVSPIPCLDNRSSAQGSNAKREGLSERGDVDAAKLFTKSKKRRTGGVIVNAVKSHRAEREDLAGREDEVAAEHSAKTKKRKKRERPLDGSVEKDYHPSDGEVPPTSHDELSGKPDGEIADSFLKTKKRKQTETVNEAPAPRGCDATGRTVESEGLSGKADVDAGELFIKTKKKKAKKAKIDITAAAKDCNSAAAAVDEDVIEQPTQPEKRKKRQIATQTLEAKRNHSSQRASDDLRESLSEHVEAAEPSTKTRTRKERKAVLEVCNEKDGASVVDDTGGNLVDGGAPLPKAAESVGEDIDLSQIQKDVDRIIGQTSSNTGRNEQKKGPPVLPWMREPLKIDSHDVLPLNRVPRLDIRLQDALRATGIQALFRVQVAVWNETVGPGRCERDLCVSSPTGSGKTLSYALPIVQKLSNRVLCRLRALIVLPTRDLAVQVKDVFETIAPPVGLKVGLAVGQTSVVAEAAELVTFREVPLHCFGGIEDSNDFAESAVDILVATPGRLMDHLYNTKDFTLQHLLFLVVDETDRLLRQSYQDWLSNVLKAVAATECGDKLKGVASLGLHKSAVHPLRTFRHMGTERGLLSTAHPRLMKMILSATLTRDPSKIAQLALHHPMYIAQSTSESRYQLPERLQAFRLVCKPGEKPLYLTALLQQLGNQQTIVFTASVVATHRLFVLLSFFEGLSFKAVEYSSLQHQQARSKSLAKFRDGEAQVLVASDAMTRGMDVEGVANVINYDMPVYAKTYVHRVGRTARAGRVGCSFTLLRREEVRHFKSLLKKADNSSCKDHKLPAASVEELNERYLTALDKLKQVTQEESVSTNPSVRGSKGDRSRGNRTEEQVTGSDELFL